MAGLLALTTGSKRPRAAIEIQQLCTALVEIACVFAKARVKDPCE